MDIHGPSLSLLLPGLPFYSQFSVPFPSSIFLRAFCYSLKSPVHLQVDSIIARTATLELRIYSKSAKRLEVEGAWEHPAKDDGQQCRE